MAGTTIENTNAVPYWDNANNTCQLSGFKAKPGELVERWDGLMVLPQFWEARHPQDFTKSVPETQTGSRRPEGADTFITTAISAEDL